MAFDSVCYECQKLTNGDCGMHGPTVIVAGSVATEPTAAKEETPPMTDSKTPAPESELLTFLITRFSLLFSVFTLGYVLGAL